MFNTNLPSGRRRLFMLVLLVFVVAGFSAKYLLIYFGWVGNADSPEKKAQVQPQPEETGKAPAAVPALSPEELKKVRSSADAFIRAYAARSTTNVEQWLQSVKPFATESLFSLLEEETTFLKENGVKVTSRFKEIRNLQCQEQSGEVLCLAETITEEKENGQTIPIERVYQVSLIEENGNWIVEEVEVRGSFD